MQGNREGRAKTFLSLPLDLELKGNRVSKQGEDFPCFGSALNVGK